MSIREITVDQLPQMGEQEGLVLQGCGGSLQEWQDGINQILTEEGILQGGTKFENISVFQHEARTCLLFPFTPEVQLDIGKLALWRLKSRTQFEGIWLSDFVDIKLGGFTQSQMQQKPDCPLIGQDGNIFNLMGLASRTLKENGMEEQAREMRQRITQCQSYDSALSIISDYVNVTSVHEMDQGLDEMSMM